MSKSPTAFCPIMDISESADQGFILYEHRPGGRLLIRYRTKLWRRNAISKLTAQSAENLCEYRTLAEKSEFGSHKYSVVTDRILFNWRLSTVEQNEYFCYPFVYPQVIQLNETKIDTYGGPIYDYWRAQYSRIKFIAYQYHDLRNLLKNLCKSINAIAMSYGVLCSN